MLNDYLIAFAKKVRYLTHISIEFGNSKRINIALKAKSDAEYLTNYDVPYRSLDNFKDWQLIPSINCPNLSQGAVNTILSSF